MPGPVHQVGRILAVVDGELRLEPDPRGVFAQEPGPDGVERAGVFGRGGGRGLRRQAAGEQALDPADQLGRGAAGEGRQHDPLRIGAAEDQRRDPVREHRRLARARPGDDQQRGKPVGRADPVLDRALLLGVERDGRGGANQGERHASTETRFSLGSKGGPAPRVRLEQRRGRPPATTPCPLKAGIHAPAGRLWTPAFAGGDRDLRARPTRPMGAPFGRGGRGCRGPWARRAPVGEDGLEQPGEPVGPGLDLRRSGDQVLPDLDQGVGEAARGGDRVDRVARERAVVGLVVADPLGHAGRALRASASSSGAASAESRSQSTPIFHRRAVPRQTGVKEWIETSAGGSPVASIASTVAATASR